ncbi:unnamed protein product [Mytilus edulis]|uniref:Receptor ligand binding region domain-containing protein n=1 Tax=Mytilus edulis TaxID=6550 RepID=A0A8S3SPW3_MYTED|nr:unnamed protein product [Mytilus edulis]
MDIISRIMFVVLAVFIFVLNNTVHAAVKSVNITVFAPKFPVTRLFALGKIQIGIEIAQEKIQMRYSRNLVLNVSFVNSNVSDTDALLAAIRRMDNGCHFFIGPVYDYAVNNIVRYAPKWNVPIVSPGGFNHGLDNKKIYAPTLTRVHATFNSMSKFIALLFQKYKWKRLKTISENFGTPEIFYGYCNLLIDAVQNQVESKDFCFDKYDIRLDRKEKKLNMVKHVLDEINTQYGGMLHSYCKHIVEISATMFLHIKLKLPKCFKSKSLSFRTRRYVLILSWI